jgi:DNA-binding NtrC family response regulator
MNPLAGNRVVLWGAQQNDLDTIRQSLTRVGLHVQPVDSLEDLRAVIEGQEVDLIVARLCRCFERPLLGLLASFHDAPSAPPVLIVADGVDVHLYLEAMRRGAFDCVGLPLNEKELIRIVTRALEVQQSQAVACGGRQ